MNVNVAKYIDALDRVDPALFGVAFVALAEKRPNEQIIVALRLALEAIDARREHRRSMIEAGQAISAARDWVTYANNHVPYDELKRRRGHLNGEVA